MFAIGRIGAALLAFTAGTIAVLGGEAAPFPYTDINTVVPGHPNLHYSDLLRQLVPDLVFNETIARGAAPTWPVPHIMGRPFVAHFGPTVSFASMQTRFIQSGGARRSLILTPVGLRTNPDDPMLLLAFSDEPKPKLLDVLDVSMGTTTTIGQPFRIGANDDALITTSDYVDAGATQGADALIFMHDGKLDSIGSFFRLAKQLCGFERLQTLDVATEPPQTPGSYDDIKVTINDIGRVSDNGCDQSVGKAPYADQYSALYQWNAAAGLFEADTTQIDILKNLNDRRQ